LPFLSRKKNLAAGRTYDDFDYNSCVAAAADMANTRHRVQWQPYCKVHSGQLFDPMIVELLAFGWLIILLIKEK
jgi:hypothetical protein